jgi:ribosomal protein S18 acetylase RimI-like enzyme
VATEIRTAKADDLPAIVKLWLDAGAEPGRTDDVASLTLLIRHDPDALLIAVEDEVIVGSAIAAWDGWRGTIYRLAVAPSHRRQRVAQALVDAAVERLRTVGAVRLQANVVQTDARATGFWRATDWTEQVERLRFTRG